MFKPKSGRFGSSGSQRAIEDYFATIPNHHMNADKILSLFNSRASSPAVEALFTALGTLTRPELPDNDRSAFHDWVLIRRQGVELGFTDSEYHAAARRSRWGHGKLLLTQAYFYSGFDDVRAFVGELPHALTFADKRETVRAKLGEYASTRHSYLNDTWDVDGYRLCVTYKENACGIDRMVCRVMAAPIQRERDVAWPALPAIASAFGAAIRSPEFMQLWGRELVEENLQNALENGEFDFTTSYGATLGLAGGGNSDFVFRSITLHRNRNAESAGWGGDLPLGLDFEDSPETLFARIKQQPVQQSDSELTGHAVWHLDGATLHVLYSNVDNWLLRIKLIAPGTWKCVDE